MFATTIMFLFPIVTTIAFTAATSAYIAAAADVERASDYDDSDAADAYLRVARTHDYYGDSGVDETYRKELEAAVNAPLDTNDDF